MLHYDLPGVEEGSPDIPDEDLTDPHGKPPDNQGANLQSFTDTLIGAEVVLSRGDGAKGICKFLREAVDDKG